MTEFNSEAIESSADDVVVADAVDADFSSEDDHDFIDVLTQSSESSVDLDEADEEDFDDDDDDDDEFAEDEGETYLADEAQEAVVDSNEPTVMMSSLPVTGEPRVDDAIARLSDLSAMPVDEHVAVFEDVQRRLHDTLADLSGQ